MYRLAFACNDNHAFDSMLSSSLQACQCFRIVGLGDDDYAYDEGFYQNLFAGRKHAVDEIAEFLHGREIAEVVLKRGGTVERSTLVRHSLSVSEVESSTVGDALADAFCVRFT